MVSNQIKFKYNNLDKDAPLKRDYDVLLSVVVDFSVWLEDKEFYSEKMFPIVEFGVNLSHWLSSQSEGGESTPLVYKSLESDEEYLLRFDPLSGGWRISSPYQRFESNEIIGDKDLKAACSELIERISSDLTKKVGVDFKRYLNLKK